MINNRDSNTYLYSNTEWTSVETKREIEETISSLNIQLKEKDENIKGIVYTYA